MAPVCLRRCYLPVLLSLVAWRWCLLSLLPRCHVPHSFGATALPNRGSA